MQSSQGFQYFLAGFNLIHTKGLKRFVLIPLLINVLLFGSSLFFIYDWLTQGFAYLNDLLPTWLSWLEWLLWPIAIFTILFSYTSLFSIITNFIAAPFNGLLSEKVECYLTGKPAPESSFNDLLKDIPRTFSREWTKLAYYLPRAIGCLILFFIPVVGQTVAPVLWFLFSAWMMAIQYCDYPFDNHKRDFNVMKAQLKQDKGCALSLDDARGACVSHSRFLSWQLQRFELCPRR